MIVKKILYYNNDNHHWKHFGLYQQKKKLTTKIKKI